MKDNFERFDMVKKPIKCKWYLKPIAWAISLPSTFIHHCHIEKINMEGIKPPYLLLGNHNAFYDMKVSLRATFPHIGNYVVAIDGFIGREQLLRNIGCICKRKFTNDILLVKHLMHVVKNKGIAVLYPEARYSLCGTTAPLPSSLGKLCKLLKVPVVTIMCNGHHINHPFWNTRNERKVKPTNATMKLLLTPEDIQNLSSDEINSLLVKEFQYDDYQWQKDNNIVVDDKNRAVGLEKILYQCPHCKTEYKMISLGNTLSCKACNKTWEMTELGNLKASKGDTEFSHIPDWYEWERDNIREEIKSGSYSSGELNVSVESLPNAKAFIKLGEGIMTHDMNGFKVQIKDKDGEVHEMIKPVETMYSCHVEYEYLFKHGDCVDLNTLQDTWYVYPKDKDFSVTKMAIATEELYYNYMEKKGKPCKEGLA